MQRERGADIRRVEQSFVEHVPRAVKAFLAGLEHEAHRPRKVRATRREHARRTDEHRDVRVVAARVHRAVDRAGVIQRRVLGHGQGVHVGAEQDDRRALRTRGAVEVGDDRRDLGARSDVEIQVGQRLHDRGLGAGQLETELGMAMDASPQVDGIGQLLGRLCQERIGGEDGHLREPRGNGREAVSGEWSIRTHSRREPGKPVPAACSPCLDENAGRE